MERPITERRTFGQAASQFWKEGQGPTAREKKRKTTWAPPDTTREQREKIVSFLYERATKGKLARGSIGEAEAHFNLHRNTVSRIWSNRSDLEGKKKGRVGRKRKHSIESIERAMERVPVRERQTIRATVESIDVPKTTIGRMVKNNEIKRNNNRLKPRLTTRNTSRRVAFVLRFVGPGTVLYGSTLFAAFACLTIFVCVQTAPVSRFL